MAVTYEQNRSSRKVLLPLLIICHILIFCGCNKGGDGVSDYYDRFAKKNAVGLVKDRNYIISYNKERGQYVYNRRRWSVRFQGDNQEYYVNVKLLDFSGNRPQEGDQIYNSIIYRTSEHSEEKELSMPMVVVKVKDIRYWLWNEENRTGVIVDLPFWDK